MVVEYSARSHVGRVRKNNEDNLYVDGIVLTPDIREFPFALDGYADGPAIFAVCDGMGGEENGEVASLIAVQSLLAADSIIKAADCSRFDEMIHALVCGMNESICADARISGNRTGTTLALAVVMQNRIYCFNMGDSRIYALHKGDFKQITNDHTPDGNPGHRLTRCIGIGGVQIAEGYPPLPLNSRILICSDGLTDMISTGEIESILRISERTANAANVLLNKSLLNGGKDNVTVIVADIKASKFTFFRRLVKKLKGSNKL